MKRWFQTRQSRFSLKCLARCAYARELNLAVDSTDLDRRAARSDLCVEVLLVDLSKNSNVRHIRVDAAVYAGHIQISIQVLGEEQLDSPVYAANVNALFAKSRERNFDSAVDPGNIRITHGLGDVYLSVDAAELDRSINLADSHSAVDPAHAEVYLTRQ